MFSRQYEENDFFGVPGRPGGRPAGAFRGGFLGTIKCSGNKCEAQCTQMLKDNTCTASGGSQQTLKDKLFGKCEAYVMEVKKELNEFWSENVLKTAVKWKEYSEDAKAKLNTLKCRYTCRVEHYQKQLNKLFNEYISLVATNYTLRTKLLNANICAVLQASLEEK